MAHMLIDASNPSFSRMVVRTDDDGEILEFDQEFSDSKSSKGNIYLATVTRVEPSLQAAFVHFGNDRNGFLPFHEIHPDYFRIPVSDRKRIMEEQFDDDNMEGDDDSEDDLRVEDAVRFKAALRRYKIQEVITRGQVLLVQVIKEERGNKGAAVSSYLSLAGRYCVLMPNDPKSGGISRKISNPEDRQRLRGLMRNMSIPPSMSLIIRTAGAGHTSDEIQYDFEYLVNCWNSLREKTLSSHAPALIHSDGDLLVRALRDFNDDSIDSIYIDGDTMYERAQALHKQFSPHQQTNIVLHDHAKSGPLFQVFNVERQLASLFLPKINLPSGGYVIIHQTEALVAIDVNSGKATSERNIEGTALNTNLEAAYEIARQLRLRDLAGLIVIDFIDMVEYRNVRQLEKKTRDLFHHDRARVQIRNMSQFGMMEMSRQRLQSNQHQHIQSLCPHCEGSGYTFSFDWIATTLTRMIAEELTQNVASELRIETSQGVCDVLMNRHRELLTSLEYPDNCTVTFIISEALGSLGFRIWRTAIHGKNGEITILPHESWQDVFEVEAPKTSGSRSRRSRRTERSSSPRANNSGEPRRRTNTRRRDDPAASMWDEGHEARSSADKEHDVKQEEETVSNERPPSRRRRRPNRQRPGNDNADYSNDSSRSSADYNDDYRQSVRHDDEIDSPAESARPEKPMAKRRRGLSKGSTNSPTGERSQSPRKSPRRQDDKPTGDYHSEEASAPPSSYDNSEASVDAPSTHTADVPAAKADTTTAVKVPRRRGRPPGSKNKPKVDAV